jgi:dTDP-4-dehydrorhamnose reductase
MARIAVTGSTGFVGGNIAEVLLNSGHEVVGLVRSTPVNSLPWESELVDFSSVESIARGAEGCVAIVHCAIANDFQKLVEDRPYAYDSYVGMTQRVVRAANSIQAQTVYISTDWTMDGTQHLVPETDMGNPLNIYGFLKALGEQVLRDLAPDTGAVCRIGGVIGTHRTSAQGPRNQDVGFGYFVASLIEALQSGKTFTVWGGEKVNKVATPSLASEIGAQVERVISLKAAGTFHLVGDDAVGRMELARAVCEVFELDTGKLEESEPPASEIFPAAVPVDTSLGNAFTKTKLKLEKTPLIDLLKAFRKELETGKLEPVTKPL